MRFGAPYSAGYGNPENHYAYTIPDTTEMARRGYTSCPVRFKLRTSPVMYPCFHHVFVNAKKVATVYDSDGAEKNVDVQIPYGTNSFSIFIMRVGQLSDPLANYDRCARVSEETENERITLVLTFVPKVVEPEFSSGTHTSSWALTGAVLGENTARVAGHPTWGRLGYTIDVDGGVATLTLTSGTRTVASGSATVLGAPFPITFTASDGSGLAGSVTVADTVADVTDGVLDVRWPKEMKIKRGTSDPPTTVIATVPFRGENQVRYTEASELAAGTYYYRTQQVSDTGSNGTESATVSIVAIGAPEPPTNLAYSSGGVADTVLSYNRSTTAGATYRLYHPNSVGGQINMDVPAQTIGSGTPGGAATIAVTSFAVAAGTVAFVLRAVSGGVEERNLNVLLVEYDAAGARVAPRPNTPGINEGGITITSGRDISVPVLYDPTREKGTATQVYFYKRTPSGSYPAVGSPDATASLSSTANGLKKATISYTFASNGYYYIRALAATAAGVTSLTTDAAEFLVFASDETMAAPTFTAELSRS